MSMQPKDQGALSPTALAGRVAFVTGAGSGIGRATVRSLAGAGAAVVAADLSLEGASFVAEEVRAHGGAALAVELDVASEPSVTAALAAATAEFGRLDAAVNCAGLRGNPRPLHEATLDDWHRVMDVNLLGVFLCMKHEIIAMLEGGAGAIVNLSSVAGISPGGAAAYGASKHGVVGLTRLAAAQYGSEGIRINVICPGAVDTPMTADIPREKRLVGPIGRTGRPEEIADVATWLCSDAASYVLGQVLAVDGGWTNR